MAIHVPKGFSLMQVPEPYSDRPILLMMTLNGSVNGFTLDNDLFVINPKTKMPQQTRFRMINCRVDLTDEAGTEIVYVDENANQASYFAFYSGWHVIQGWGIVSIAGGIDSTQFQLGI